MLSHVSNMRREGYLVLQNYTKVVCKDRWCNPTILQGDCTALMQGSILKVLQQIALTVHGNMSGRHSEIR